jgi:hypothetical protein
MGADLIHSTDLQLETWLHLKVTKLEITDLYPDPVPLDSGVRIHWASLSVSMILPPLGEGLAQMVTEVPLALITCDFMTVHGFQSASLLNE